jgi:AcrR family transcriptional regulator
VATARKVSRSRNPGSSRDKILRVALQEFAKEGLSGARVDRIAERAKTSKNMIYYHFQNKDGLYREVMKGAYVSHREAERDAEINLSDPVGTLKSLIIRSFDYLCRNEMFVRLVMSENMNHGKHMKHFDDLKEENKGIIDTLDSVLQEGKKRGLFRDGIAPIEVHLTISALGFHYVSNKYTFARLFDIDMNSEEAFRKRREEVVDIILRWCLTNPD